MNERYFCPSSSYTDKHTKNVSRTQMLLSVLFFDVAWTRPNNVLVPGQLPSIYSKKKINEELC